MSWLAGLGGIGIVLLAAVVALRWWRRRNQVQPAFLASQALHRPERLLLDLPRALAHVPAAAQHRYLLDTEAELARVGGIGTRREFFTRVASVAREPSTQTIGELANFLCHQAPNEFRQALEWGGRCEAALLFFRVVDVLDSSRSGGSREGIPADVSRANDRALHELRGTDREVAKEWFRLLTALHSLSSPRRRSKGSKRQQRRRRHGEGRSAKATKGAKGLPRALTEPEMAPHLQLFQAAARELFIEVRKALVGGERG